MSQAASLDRVVYSREEYRRTAAASDAAVLTRDPLSPEVELPTLIRDSDDAVSFRDMLYNLRKLPCGDWTCNIARGVFTGSVGDTITIVYPRFGLAAGKNFIVKRIRTDLSVLYDAFTLFGPQ